jgi:multimeric flavodoxin WrbA
MQVLVLTGSPHPKGTTACLADAFSEGAAAAGHDVVRFDTAQLTVPPALAASTATGTAGFACMRTTCGSSSRRFFAPTSSRS